VIKNGIPGRAYLEVLATDAGRIMRNAFQFGTVEEWKEDNTPLTISDTAINSLVIHRLKKDFPHISVVGEEESRDVPNSRYTILVDPIDGTIPFKLCIPVSTFCISVLDNRVPIAALVYDPFMNRMWYAQKGEGAFFNGKPVRVSQHNKIEKSYISLCFWNTAPFNLGYVCNDLMDGKAKWINLNSVAICAGLIASGSLTASIAPCNKAWETAAMQVIVEEAGGKATDLMGNPLVYSEQFTMPGHIISNGYIHDELVEMVQRAMKLPKKEKASV
jgi:fructose-1,6-bisphosphatase/inositol monophosphatase family enzyme